MELIKKQIHMNQFKGTVTTQITLDDDFIVPDTMDDMAQVMLDTGEIQIESVKNQGEKVAVKGKLEFQVLYRKEGGGLQTLGGSIPFDETINAPDLEEKDYVGLNWMLEDLNAEMINSRKLGVQAIITLQVRIETLRDVEAAVDVDMGNGGFAAQTPGDATGPAQIETLKRTVNVAAIAVRRKDTYRMKEEISLTGGKPNIGRLLWREMKLRDVTTKPLDGKLHIDGDLSVFAIYQAEDENMPMQWLEETLPFSGDLDLSDAVEEMVPMVTVRLAHKDLEPKPDYDGEMRELDVDAVLELDIKLYQEQDVELLSDMYSTSREVELTRSQACFDRDADQKRLQMQGQREAGVVRGRAHFTDLPQRGYDQAGRRRDWGGQYPDRRRSGGEPFVSDQRRRIAGAGGGGAGAFPLYRRGQRCHKGQRVPAQHRFGAADRRDDGRRDGGDQGGAGLGFPGVAAGLRAGDYRGAGEPDGYAETAGTSGYCGLYRAA